MLQLVLLWSHQLRFLYNVHPGLSLCFKDLGNLVFDAPWGAETIIGKRGVKLHGGGSSARKLDGVLASRHPSTTDERDRSRKETTQGS